MHPSSTHINQLIIPRDSLNFIPFFFSAVAIIIFIYYIIKLNSSSLYGLSSTCKSFIYYTTQAI